MQMPKSDIATESSPNMKDEIPPDLVRDFRHLLNFLAAWPYRSSFNAAEAIVPHFFESLWPYVETLLQNTLKNSATTQAWSAHIRTFLEALNRQVVEDLQTEYARRSPLRTNNESHKTENELALPARLVAFYLAYRVAVGRTSCNHEPELMVWLAELCVLRSCVAQDHNQSYRASSANWTPL